MSGITESDEGKPFWLRPPWVVLFDLLKLRDVRPWDINLALLLNSFLEEMRTRGFIDFKTSGIALLSSATIFRMQSELVLELQEPSRMSKPSEEPEEYVPTPIQLPYRFEFSSTNVDNLIQALEEVLVAGQHATPTPRLVPVPTVLPDVRVLDEFLVDIEKRIEDLHLRIARLLNEADVVTLSTLIVDQERIEQIRCFILLLFLASRGDATLRQDEGSEEIYITLPNVEAR
jgi:chromatin segregation and condensation protein Rec8/ScpA/Scc1 (kleisin family)